MIRPCEVCAAAGARLGEYLEGCEACDPMVRGPLTPAEYTADYREHQAARGRCRDCTEPVATKRNGKPARSCARHLKADRKRKGYP